MQIYLVDVYEYTGEVLEGEDTGQRRLVNYSIPSEQYLFYTAENALEFVAYVNQRGDQWAYMSTPVDFG